MSYDESVTDEAKTKVADTIKVNFAEDKSKAVCNLGLHSTDIGKNQSSGLDRRSATRV